jgi:hypothetical protein
MATCLLNISRHTDVLNLNQTQANPRLRPRTVSPNLHPLGLPSSVEHGASPSSSPP